MVLSLHSFKFINKTPTFGKSFVCIDDKNIENILFKIKNKNYYTYGLNKKSNFQILNIIECNEDYIETKQETIILIVQKIEDVNNKNEIKPVDNIDETVDNDFKYARENLYNIIERGYDALNTLVDVANQSQHPRAFEVVGQLVKTLSDTNKDLLELQKKVKVIKKDIPDQPQNVTNELFVGIQ